MFSGTKDVHWTLQERDINWFYSYMDENYLALLNEMYRSSRHPEMVKASPRVSAPLDCAPLTSKTATNVEAASAAAARAGARLSLRSSPMSLPPPSG
jgi:hypothetical protein